MKFAGNFKYCLNSVHDNLSLFILNSEFIVTKCFQFSDEGPEKMWHKSQKNALNDYVYAVRVLFVPLEDHVSGIQCLTLAFFFGSMSSISILPYDNIIVSFEYAVVPVCLCWNHMILGNVTSISILFSVSNMRTHFFYSVESTCTFDIHKFLLRITSFWGIRTRIFWSVYQFIYFFPFS